MREHVNEVAVTRLPGCDMTGCAMPAVYDAKTVGGPWAYLCSLHFGLYGIGLGLGRGQRLVLAREER